MKKLFVALLAAAAVGQVAQAQTDFRHISFDEACTAAKAEGKQVFIDFYTDWCGPCKRMAAQVLPTKEVGDYLNSHFVCLKVNAEKEDGPQLAKRYEVHAYPTFCVIDPATGDKVGDFAGYREGREFISKIEACRDPELRPERLKARYEGGERSPKVVAAYASMAVDSSRDYMAGLAKAQGIVDEYFASLTPGQRVEGDNWFVYTSYRPSYGTERAQFLIDNIAAFGGAKDIREVYDGIYEDKAIRSFSTPEVNQDGGAAAFAAYAADARAKGFGDKLGNMIAFTEQRLKLTPEEYVDYVAANFGKLTPEEQSYMVTRLDGAFNPQTPGQVKKVCEWARSIIGTLPGNAMVWCAYGIDGLENPKKKH